MTAVMESSMVVTYEPAAEQQKLDGIEQTDERMRATAAEAD